MALRGRQRARRCTFSEARPTKRAGSVSKRREVNAVKKTSTSCDGKRSCQRKSANLTPGSEPRRKRCGIKELREKRAL